MYNTISCSEQNKVMFCNFSYAIIMVEHFAIAHTVFVIKLIRGKVYVRTYIAKNYFCACTNEISTVHSLAYVKIQLISTLAGCCISLISMVEVKKVMQHIQQLLCSTYIVHIYIRNTIVMNLFEIQCTTMHYHDKITVVITIALIGNCMYLCTYIHMYVQ